MLRIETVRVEELWGDRSPEEVLGELCPGHREELERVTAETYRRESAAAELLLQRMVREMNGAAEPQDWRWQRGEHGKPRIPQLGGLEFSLSHDGGMAACALSDRPVGVDIHRIGPVREAVLRRYLGGPEQKRIRDAADPQREFALCWALREAVAKWSGEGLTMDLQEYWCDARADGEPCEVWVGGSCICRAAVREVSGMMLAAAFADVI